MARYANEDLRFVDTLVWADAIFFRRHVDAATKRVQALIAAAVYHKPSLALHLLDAAAES
ncbi:hypothetical protein SAMN07250955_106253 [Arboricoccus pini]|uniref:Uncharacterized protein n=1 Tax=Arboricoccus pini TaxID=1963835 RepID=A0A212R9I2_9PROT|nr:hypothetical protein [Arboricoccus pini]SNB68852.1 hypothetical protein SAMN07250955_106253 [Arboricoccus pini]